MTVKTILSFTDRHHRFLAERSVRASSPRSPHWSLRRWSR